MLQHYAVEAAGTTSSVVSSSHNSRGDIVHFNALAPDHPSQDPTLENSNHASSE